MRREYVDTQIFDRSVQGEACEGCTYCIRYKVVKHKVACLFQKVESLLYRWKKKSIEYTSIFERPSCFDQARQYHVHVLSKSLSSRSPSLSQRRFSPAFTLAAAPEWHHIQYIFHDMIKSDESRLDVKVQRPALTFTFGTVSLVYILISPVICERRRGDECRSRYDLSR